MKAIDIHHPLQVGDILVSRWGWDQTNRTFYRVVKVTPVTVRLVKLQQVHTEYRPGALAGTTVPTDEEIGKPFRRTVITGATRDDSRVSIDYYEMATLWDGRPAPYTAYA